MADGEPRPAPADEEAVYAGGVNERDDGGIFDKAEAAAFEVVDAETEQLREKEDVVRHRESPVPINSRRAPGSRA